MHRKEKKRLSFSFVFSMAIHAGLILGLGLVAGFKPPEVKEDLGPIFLQLEPKPLVKVQEDSENTAPEIKDSPPEEKPAPEEKEVADKEEQAAPEESSNVQDVPVPESKVEKDPLMAREDKNSENTFPERTEDRITATPSKATPKPQVTPAPTPLATPMPTEEPSVLDDLNNLDQALANIDDESDSDSDKSTMVKNEKTSNSQSGDKEGPTFNWGSKKSRSVISSYPVDLPDWVSEKGLSLFVRLSFDLASDGQIISVRVDESSGYTDVDTAVKSALLKYKFNGSDSGVIRGIADFPINLK